MNTEGGKIAVRRPEKGIRSHTINYIPKNHICKYIIYILYNTYQCIKIHT